MTVAEPVIFEDRNLPLYVVMELNQASGRIESVGDSDVFYEEDEASMCALSLLIGEVQSGGHNRYFVARIDAQAEVSVRRCPLCCGPIEPGTPTDTVGVQVPFVAIDGPDEDVPAHVECVVRMFGRYGYVAPGQT